MRHGNSIDRLHCAMNSPCESDCLSTSYMLVINSDTRFRLGQVTLRRSEDTVAVSQCYLSKSEPGVSVLHVNGAQIVSVLPEELATQFEMSHKQII